MHLGGDLGSAKFSETYHCETLLLSLYAFQAAIRSAFGNTKTSDTAFSVAPDVISTFKVSSQTFCNDLLVHPKADLISQEMNESLLMVSKRCCPACHKLVELVRAELRYNGKDDLLYPGSHVVWSAVALPPWLPKQYGEQIVKHAEDVLIRRIEEIVALKRINKKRKKRSPSEESTHAFHEPPHIISLEHAKRRRV